MESNLIEIISESEPDKSKVLKSLKKFIKQLEKSEDVSSKSYLDKIHLLENFLKRE